MDIQELSKRYAKLPQVSALARAMADERLADISLTGLVASSAPMVFGAMSAKCQHPLLFVLQDAEEAGYFYHDLTQLLGQERVLFLPSSYRRAVKYGQRDAASEILRTEALTALTTAKAPYVVTYPEAMAEQVVTKRQMDEQRLLLSCNQSIAPTTIIDSLRHFGFSEVDYVYEPGQYAQRGSILDVYSYSCEYPYRIDFFGDDIDSIRTFEVETQLSRDKRDNAEIVPQLSAADEREPLLAFLPQSTVLVVRDFDYLCEMVDRTYSEGFSRQAVEQRLSEATEMERSLIEEQLRSESQLTPGSLFRQLADGFRKVHLGQSPSARQSTAARIEFHTSAQPLFHKNFEMLGKSLSDYALKGYATYILADSQKQNERLSEILSQQAGKAPTTVPGGFAAGEAADAMTLFTPVERTLHEGFIDHDLKLCLFTDHQIFDRFHKYNLRSDKARSGKMALTLKEIQMFEVGDYIVHVDHGIGRFGGLVRMPMAGGTYQEMIKITYQRGDAIYVSIHALHKVSKYKSQDNGEPPRLSTLGTGQWERLKERTKKHIKDIARDLIKLYATRRRQKGFAYSPDSYLQHELEASFLYEDTPDQLRATQDVKADMERAVPMDRLVCGDVGFGKTEVAVRAAFKAACDGKQTAVLVPTTVLAYQHYRTFSGRLKDMPVRVDYLTRARTTKQAKALLKDLADGKVDIIIGTHKLIGKTVKFHDLGLLIIDEEQKFGVGTKEKLRQLKTNVDTLTMSATPIPRTLQFSLVGARDLSTIQTPPPNRYPIQTEIHTFSPEIIADAVNFELSRNGQVYIVNNRINDLSRLEDLLHKYVPDARVAIGHGRMKPEELEQVVLDFSNHDYDVLLSTTIVENGIDIPNANTIIINAAHYFGLSDLHQMRGRVGRGNRKAFCYLLAPPLSALPVDARRRLEALENFSDLGSGINIAMQDLDIRGAGNLLGAEQSGFISDLGYETYQKILTEAMTELRNEEPPLSPAVLPPGEPMAAATTLPTATRASQDGDRLPTSMPFVSDCTVDADLEMYFPDHYVPTDSERMLLYRELDNIGNRNDLATAQQMLSDYRRRMTDRFGPLPAMAEELTQVVPLRIMGKQLGCERIVLKQGRMTLHFVSAPNSPFYQSAAFDRIIEFATANVRRCSLRETDGKRSMTVTQVPTAKEAVNVLSTIAK